MVLEIVLSQENMVAGTRERSLRELNRSSPRLPLSNCLNPILLSPTHKKRDRERSASAQKVSPSKIRHQLFVKVQFKILYNFLRKKNCKRVSIEENEGD